MAVITKKIKDKSQNSVKKSSTIDHQDHDIKIAKIANYRTEKRKFALGYELKDWFEEDQGYLSQ